MTAGCRPSSAGAPSSGLRGAGLHVRVLGAVEGARGRVIVLGWYVPGPEAEAFLAGLGGWITPFDWMAWGSSPAGQALLGHPDAVASASTEDLRKLLTVYVRGERFGEGTLENAFKAGMLTAIMRRAGVLAAELERAR